MRRTLSLHLSALAVLLGLLLASPAAATAAAPEYFNLPSGITTEVGIAVQPDGTVWFPANHGETHTPGIGRLEPGEASPGTSDGVSVFPTPTPTAEPYPCCANAVRSVAVDALHKRLWFVQNEGVVGFAETEKVVSGTSTGMSATRVEDNEIWDVAFSPSTELAWFTEHGASNRPPYPGERIASIDENLNVRELHNLAIQKGGEPVEPEFELRYDPEPSGITTEPDGKPWFAEESGDSGWRLGTAPADSEETSPYTEYELESCPSLDGCIAPTDVAIAPDGSVWYTTTNNEIGRLNATHTEFENFSMTSIDSGFAEGKAERITAASDGTIWVSESGFYGHSLANALVRIVPSAVPTTTVYPLASNAPYALAADTKGNIWFTATAEVGDSDEIGRLAEVVGSSPVVTEETTPTGTSTTTTTTSATITTTAPSTSPTEKPLTPVRRGTAKISPPIPKGNSVTAEQICIGPPSQPCAVVYLLSAGEYTTGFPGTKASVAKKRRGVVLGRTAVTLHGGQRKKITVKLDAAGMRLLKRKHTLVLYFTATQAGLGSSPPQLLKRAKIVLHYHR